MQDHHSSRPTHARSLLKDFFQTRKLFPLLTATFCFALFLLAFILLPYFRETPAFLEDERTLLSVFHDKFARADFSSYTFQSGLGISIARLMLTGSGGILSLIGSLLPTKIHPQTVLFLSALRLGLSAFFFSHLHLKYIRKSSFLRVLSTSLLYALGAFSFSILLRLPIAETYVILPIVLLLFTDNLSNHRPAISPGTFIATGCLFISNLPLAFLLLPILLITVFYLGKRIRKEDFRTLTLKFLAHTVLVFGLCGSYLIPQTCQLGTLFRKADPTSQFLWKTGSDNSLQSTETTFSCEATSVLLEKPASLVVTSSRSSDSDFSMQRESHLQLLNDWIYSLWPSLPVKPFRNISTELPKPTYIDSQNVEFRITTLFLDPLFATVELPHLHDDVQVFLNNNPMQTIRNNPNPVIVSLGSYNVGQALTLRLSSSDPSSIRDAKACFGYFSSYDWSKYTENANFGITNYELRSDGISAEMTISEESLLLTDIPFEKGWELYLNGQRASLVPYENAFLSATIAPGNHILFLRYSPPGFMIGNILSGVSMLLLAAYYFSKSSPKKSQSNESRKR